MRVVKPSIICIILDISFLILFFGVVLDWIWTTSGVAVPLAMNRVLGPNRWEDFAQINLVEMGAEVVILHPPVSVALENVIELLLQPFMVVPSLILVGKLTSPLALAPRISDPNELEPIDLPNLLDTVGMVVKNSGSAHSFFKVAVLILDSIGTTQEEAKRMELLEVFPELATLN